MHIIRLVNEQPNWIYYLVKLTIHAELKLGIFTTYKRNEHFYIESDYQRAHLCMLIGMAYLSADNIHKRIMCFAMYTSLAGNKYGWNGAIIGHGFVNNPPNRQLLTLNPIIFINFA